MDGVSRRAVLAASAGTALAAVPMHALAAVPASRAADTPFDAGWQFHLGDVPRAERPAFADAGRRALDLPPDWSLEDRPGAPTKTSWGMLVAVAYAGGREIGRSTQAIVQPTVVAARQRCA